MRSSLRSNFFRKRGVYLTNPIHVKAKLFYVGLVILLVTSCKNDDVQPNLNSSYFIFGSFNGFCAGHDCNTYYYLSGEDLNKVANTNLPGDLIRLNPFKYDDQKVLLAKDLLKKLPTKLFDESQIVGCPDCLDQGGVYIEIQTAKGKRSWFIDNDTAEIPEYLRDFVHDVHAKLAALQ